MRKIWITLVVIIVAFEVGGTAYTELNNNEPVSVQTLKVDATHPWNFGLVVISPYDNNAEINNIKAGVNARPATQEEIKNFLNSTSPILEQPKPGENAPTIRVMMPFNPENATSATIKNNPVENLQMKVKFTELMTNIEGNNVPIPIPLIEGAGKVDLKIQIRTGTPAIDFRYYLNDGRLIRAHLYFYDNNYVPTNLFKEIPAYNYAKLKLTPDQVDALPAKEFNLNDNSIIELFRTSGSIKFVFEVGSEGIGGLSPVLPTENGEALYLSNN
jgi:hypothetical protein